MLLNRFVLIAGSQLRRLHLCPIARELRPLRMAALSPTMTTGHIQKWLHAEGEKVDAGDAFCDIETDKAVVGLECMDDAILAKIVKPEGSRDIQIGELIGWIVDAKDDLKSVKIPEKDPNPPVTENTGSTASSTSSSVADDRVMAMSAAINSIVDKYGMMMTPMAPSSTESDLIEYMRKCGIDLKTNSEGEKWCWSLTKWKNSFKNIPVTSIRSIVASRLTLSKVNPKMLLCVIHSPPQPSSSFSLQSTIPHEYAEIDCQMDEVLRARKKINSQNEKVKISVNDFIVSAVAHSLTKVPEMNAIFDKNEHKLKEDIDVAVAVSIPDGLITPIVRKANTLTLAQISEKIKELANRAKDRRLKPQEFQGSSFTVSNLGMFGIKTFSAVINPPEVGILAVGTSRSVAHSLNSSANNVMCVTLSYDARALTPTSSQSFLNHVKKFLEEPHTLI